MKPQHTDKHTQIICPNCGFKAEHNYCAQCGQETHLHKETFWGLIMHFVGHYFHYDSKFWQTLKALWFSPGKLTKAYMLNQRMRYIPPISLYIFISAVFFLVLFSFPKKKENSNGGDVRQGLRTMRGAIDSMEESLNFTSDSSIRLKYRETEQKDTSYLSKKFEKIQKEHGDKTGKYLGEKFWHNFPKIFFFLIPFLALTLKLLFLRRKQLHFVHHAIYSLHLHSFFFSIMLIRYLNPFSIFDQYLKYAVLILGAIYLVVSLKRVYEISYRRAILSAFFIAWGYAFSFALATLAIIAGTFIAA